MNTSSIFSDFQIFHLSNEVNKSTLLIFTLCDVDNALIFRISLFQLYIYGNISPFAWQLFYFYGGYTDNLFLRALAVDFNCFQFV